LESRPSTARRISDANTVLNLLLDVRTSLKYSSVPIVVIALTVGSLFNDAGKFLANFTPAQVAYYELFLRESRNTFRVELVRESGPKY